MGFLHLLRNSSDKDDKLVKFCNIVDKEYMKAFPTKSTRGLETYLSRDCLMKIQRRVFSNENVYFATEKFRKTEWNVISEGSTGTIIEKIVTYDNIKISRNLKISVADNYKEVWEVNRVGDLFTVTDIKKGNIAC